jgi:hypothetical protein
VIYGDQRLAAKENGDAIDHQQHPWDCWLSWQVFDLYLGYKLNPG